MATYKKRVSKTGRETFFKDGKRISRALLPAELLEMEEGQSYDYDDNSDKVGVKPNGDKPARPQATLETTTPITNLDESQGPVSYLSGEPATRRKWLNGQVYWLTEEEYHKYNLGKLAQAIREREQKAQTVED